MDAINRVFKIMEKTQLNARVRPSVKEATKRIADVGDFTQEEIIEIALANLLGTRDELMIAKRNKIQRLATELDLDLTFKSAQLQFAEFAA